MKAHYSGEEYRQAFLACVARLQQGMEEESNVRIGAAAPSSF